MDIKIGLKENDSIDVLKLQKMVLLYNAVEEGWEIKKNKDKYIFIKKHEGKKEVLLDSYLRRFVERNMDINKIINS